MQTLVNVEKKKSGGIHEGHKKRLRSKFISELSFSGFMDHEILEMLLSYSCVRKNTNEMAHLLIKRFGSLHGVFNASFESLMEVEGIGEQTATLIVMQKALFGVYQRNKTKVTGADEEFSGVLNYVLSLFENSNCEQMYMLSLNSANRVITHHLLSNGNGNAVVIDRAKMIKNAYADRAKSVLFAHNHPSGVLIPSNTDIENTRLLTDIFEIVGITVTDHLLVANGECISIMNDKRFEIMRKMKNGRPF